MRCLRLFADSTFHILYNLISSYILDISEKTFFPQSFTLLAIHSFFFLDHFFRLYFANQSLIHKIKITESIFIKIQSFIQHCSHNFHSLKKRSQANKPRDSCRYTFSFFSFLLKNTFLNQQTQIFQPKQPYSFLLRSFSFISLQCQTLFSVFSQFLILNSTAKVKNKS